ncbi:MAG TPA: His/Gly/Thr/Pro-type tRNA ligase C-terminal domain-containing protein, partial [Candidatus Limnocylindrales bacterium]|nr:His/Gly/Thr/Pro-type tRNA ligase C-terminal domain-containing protein [Candidatus Limnocylindrales bacterium]
MLRHFLEVHDLLPTLHPATQLYVVVIGDILPAAQRMIAALRKAGLNVAADITGRKIGSQIQTAEKKGIHYVLFIGEQELTSEQFVLKNLHTGVEEKHGLSRIISIVNDYRHSDDDGV